MPNYRITVRDGNEPAEGVEHHANVDLARGSAARSAINILVERRSGSEPLTATVTVRDESTGITHTVLVSILVSHTVDRP